MPVVPLQNLGLRGLNSDTPSQSLDSSEFSAGMNLRPFDGSLQSVYDATFDNDLAPDDDVRNIYAFAQWTPTGSNSFNVVYFWDNGNTGLDFQIVQDLTGNNFSISGFSAMTDVADNARFNLDLFAFNDVLIVNDGVSQPVVVLPMLGNFDNDDDTPDTDGYVARFILNWPNGVSDTAQADDDDRITAQRILHYNNRLIALNVSGNYLGDDEDSDSDDVQYGNVSLLWSTPITDLETLNNVTFLPAATNSAGDDIVTETVGEILDAGQLGEYLIVYKEDGVLQYTDTGDPLYLVGRLLFEDDGLYSPGCFADIGDGRHFVVGNYGIYLHDGGPNKKNISRGRIEREIYRSVDRDARDRAFVFRHSADKEVWLCYKDTAPSFTGSGCNMAFVYNYQHDTWYQRTLPISNGNGIRGMTEGELNGQLYVYLWGEEGPKRLGDERFFATPGFVGGGRVEFTRHDFEAPQSSKSLHHVYPMCTNDIVVNITTTRFLYQLPDFDVDDDRNFDPRAGYKLDYRLHGRYFHMELTARDNGGDDGDEPTNPEITGIGLDIAPMGER